MTELRRYHGDHTISVRSVRAGWDRLDASWVDSAAARYERQHAISLLDEATRFGRALDVLATAVQAIENDLL